MTTLNGDKCPTCGYAFTVFDRSCPRCFAFHAGAREPGVACSKRPSKRVVQFLGYLLLWASLSVAVASVCCCLVLRMCGNL